MKKLTAANVENIFRDCLFQDGEDTSKAVLAEGVISKFGFNPERLASHKAEIGELLLQLPENFQMDKGGGWSFLQACVTQDGEQWGEHSNMEQLFALGLATEQAVCLMPRDMWQIMPGGMPYYGVTVAAPKGESFDVVPDPAVTVDTTVPKPEVERSAETCEGCVHRHYINADPLGSSTSGWGCKLTGGHAITRCSSYLTLATATEKPEVVS